MNQCDISGNDDVRFDRLVDGELNDTERHQLLALLDDEPGGWRCCALAFLEVQAWRQTMREVSRGAGAVTGENGCSGEPESQLLKPAKPTPYSASIGDGHDDKGSHRPSLIGLALAMGVCFLVAFFLGTEFRQRWSPDRPLAPLAKQQAPITTEFPVEATLPEFEAQTPETGIVPWGEATFVMDGDGGREVDVPVFDLDPYSRQVLLEQSTAVFDDLHQALQRDGFEVRRNVRWSPVEMPGGQQMTVPIGEFEIRPISQRKVQ
jgi:hypothetical protein